MNEHFLQYVWQQKLFAATPLRLTDGREISIIHSGFKNTDAGPDFSMCKINMEGTQLTGDAEIHVQSSDWNRHRHSSDPAYNKVILHVVWSHDVDVKAPDGTILPCLELKDLVDPQLLYRYKDLMLQSGALPCAGAFAEVDATVKYSMMDRMLIDRLQEKAGEAGIILKALHGDKEETAWHLTAKTFGFHTNANAMIRLAGIIPYKILQKHRDKLTDLESLLFGCAGFLEHPVNEYADRLKENYEFLAHKYGLKPRQMNAAEWKFLRMRPQNFPTVRLAQLTGLIQQFPGLHAFLTEIEHPSTLYRLNLLPSAYWQSHYYFNKPVKHLNTGPGKASMESLIINASVPLMALEAKLTDNAALTSRAVALLEKLPSEDNKYTRVWTPYGIGPTNAGEAQALLQWYKRRCSVKKCLDCAVGHRILRQS